MEPEEDEARTTRLTRSIYGQQEDWDYVDGLADKLKWKFAPVVMHIIRKFREENPNVHLGAVELLTFQMGWSPNDPAGVSDSEDSAA